MNDVIRRTAPRSGTAVSLFFLIASFACDRGEGQDASRANAPGASAVPEQRAEHAGEVHLTAEAVISNGIKIEAAARHVLVPTLTAPARVAFNAEAMAHVGSPLMGRVSDLRARLGDDVKKGDVLLIVESPELGGAQSDFLQKRAAASAAGPSVELAKSSYERAKALYDKSEGIALTEVQKRESEFRAADAARAIATAAAEGAENRLHLFGMDQAAVDLLAKTTEITPHFAVTAPISGRVIQREVTLGELVSPEKEALLVLAGMDTLWVLADVPEARLAEIAVGNASVVTVGTGKGAIFRGAVSMISPAVDPTTRSAQVRIEVKEGAAATLRPGMFARVEIETGDKATEREAVLAVPDEAVQTVEGVPSVFVPIAGDETAFARRAVRIGAPFGGMIPILAGLAEGERIVVAGSFILKAELGKGSAEDEG